jgi:hypothetical protein
MARFAVHGARREPAREDVDGARDIDRAWREHIDEQELPFGNGMHRNVAIVVQERRGQTTRFALVHGRHDGRIHPGGASRGHEQAAEEGTIAELVCRHAEKIGEDVLVVARQAREGGTRRRTCRRADRRGNNAKLDLAARGGKQRPLSASK